MTVGDEWSNHLVKCAASSNVENKMSHAFCCWMLPKPTIVRAQRVFEIFNKQESRGLVIFTIFAPTSISAPFDFQLFLFKIIMFSTKISSEGSFGWEVQGYIDDTFASLSSLGSSSKDRGSCEQCLTFENSVATSIQVVNKVLMGEPGLGEEAAQEKSSDTIREIQVDTTIESDKQNLLEVPEYDWVAHEVREYATRFKWGNVFVELADHTYISKDEVKDVIVHLCMCWGNDRVCHGKKNSKLDFFFVYSCLFTNMFMRIPFEDLNARVISELNVSPTQLHQNV